MSKWKGNCKWRVSLFTSKHVMFVTSGLERLGMLVSRLIVCFIGQCYTVDLCRLFKSNPAVFSVLPRGEREKILQSEKLVL